MPNLGEQTEGRGAEVKESKTGHIHGDLFQGVDLHPSDL